MKPTYRPLILSAVALTTGATASSAIAQAAAKPEEAPKWKQSAGVGLSLTQGNSETLLVTADYSGVKKWRDNELTLGLNGGYGENDTVKNNEYVKGFGQYNLLFGEAKRWYGFARLGAGYDGIADIDYRVNISGGLGYYFLKEGLNDNKRFNLSAEVGPGFVTERVGGQNKNYGTIYVSEKFGWKINDKSRLWQSLDFSPQIDDVENNVVNLELGIASKLTETIELRAVLSDTYRSRPAPNRKNNDLKLVSAITYSF